MTNIRVINNKVGRDLGEGTIVAFLEEVAAYEYGTPQAIAIVVWDNGVINEQKLWELTVVD